MFWFVQVLLFMLGIVMFIFVRISPPEDNIGFAIVLGYYLLALGFIASPIVSIILRLKNII